MTENAPPVVPVSSPSTAPTDSLTNPKATQSLLAIIVTTGAIVTIGAATVAALFRGADPTTFVALGASLAQTALGYYFLDKANATPATTPP